MRTDRFDHLYEEHAQALFGFLAYRTGDPVLAEDLVADTFERVLAARRPFDRRKASEKTWIYAIALNRLRDMNGNGHRGALAALDDDEREALSLRYGADLSLSEIAKLIGQPRSTVEGRIYRGLKRLRAELAGEGEQVADARAALG